MADWVNYFYAFLISSNIFIFYFFSSFISSPVPFSTLSLFRNFFIFLSIDFSSYSRLFFSSPYWSFSWGYRENFYIILLNIFFNYLCSYIIVFPRANLYSKTNLVRLFFFYSIDSISLMSPSAFNHAMNCSYYFLSLMTDLAKAAR